jgi:Fur family ferric uptake transcriptional regulator
MTSRLDWRGEARAPPDEDLRRLLAAKGLRVTERRMAVLRELAKLRAPASHPELTARLEGAGLDRTTVYRNLVSLTGAGLLVRTRLGDNVWRFGLPGTKPAGHRAHPHFVCNDCGAVSCLPEGAVALRGAAVRNQVAEIQLRGRCVACARE